MMTHFFNNPKIAVFKNVTFFSLTYSAEQTDERNLTKFTRKRKPFEFSKRWNQAQFCVLICLETVLILSYKVPNI